MQKHAHKSHTCWKTMMGPDMFRSQKSGSKIRRIRGQNKMSRSKICRISWQNHLARIQDLQDLTTKQKTRIQDLQDPTAIMKNQDPGSPGSHNETKKIRIQDQQDPRYPGSQDRTNFKDPRSAGSHQWMFKVQYPQEPATKCREPWYTVSDGRNYK